MYLLSYKLHSTISKESQALDNALIHSPVSAYIRKTFNSEQNTSYTSLNQLSWINRIQCEKEDVILHGIKMEIIWPLQYVVNLRELAWINVTLT